MGKTDLYAVIGLARAGAPAARFLAEQGERVIGYDDRPLEELSLDARRLLGLGVEMKTGAHEFKGLENCTKIVLSPGVKIHQEPMKKIIAAAEKRGVEVIGELELAYRHCPAPIIAVTGTKGKSTTVKLISEMLTACGIHAVRAGNTGTPLISVLGQLNPESWAVVEVSSFQLEKAPKFRPVAAVLLNLLPDHMDYHPTLLQYWNTKLNIFANQTEDETAIFNVDDPAVADLARGQGDFYGWRENLKAKVMVSSARVAARTPVRDPLANVRQEWLGWDRGEEWLPIVPLDGIPLRGNHNLSNVAAALAAVGAAVGNEVLPHRDAVTAAVRNFESLPHRLQLVSDAFGITWINDSQATIPAAAIAALEAFEAPVTLIVGGQAKLDASAYEALGQAVVRRAHHLVTIGEAGEMIGNIAQRLGFAPEKITDAGVMGYAVATAKEVTPVGGTVVMSPACASFDQFKNYEERGEAFATAVLELQRLLKR